MKKIKKGYKIVPSMMYKLYDDNDEFTNLMAECGTLEDAVKILNEHIPILKKGVSANPLIIKPTEKISETKEKIEPTSSKKKSNTNKRVVKPNKENDALTKTKSELIASFFEMDFKVSYEKLIKTFDSNTKKVAKNNMFDVLYKKAFEFLNDGPEIYRFFDAYKMPQKKWNDDELTKVTEGCKQILQGKGLTEENPLENLDVDGFYRLFELFHFANIARQTKRIKIDGKTKFLDTITFKHFHEKWQVTYSNLVSYS